MAEAKDDFYFTQFHANGFEFDRTAPLSTEFDRLAKLMGWALGSQEYCIQRSKAEEAAVTPDALSGSLANLTIVTPTSPITTDSNSDGQNGEATTMTVQTVPKDFTVEGTATEGHANTSAYFLSFVDEGFIPNPLATFDSEFERLAILKGWGTKKDKRGKLNDQYVRQLHKALESEFHMHYGSVQDLTTWQGLCRLLRVKTVPINIEQCKWEIEKIDVCITCLIDRTRKVANLQQEGGAIARIHIFSTTKELSSHCRGKSHVYPQFAEEKYGFLKVFLRRIDSAAAEDRRYGR